MKILTTVLSLAILMMSCSKGESEEDANKRKEEERKQQIIPISNSEFKAFLARSCDTNGDGEISVGEAEAVTRLECNDMDLVSLEELDRFAALEVLHCRGNLLTTLDITSNTKIKEVDCSNNPLVAFQSKHFAGFTKLDISDCPKLTALSATDMTALKDLNISRCTSLAELDVNWLNALETLRAEGCTALKEIRFEGDKIKIHQIILTGCTALTELLVSGGAEVSQINVKGCVSLRSVHTSMCPYLASLDVSGLTNLVELYCFGNGNMTEIKAVGCTKLEDLQCKNSALTRIDVAGSSVRGIDCSGNKLQELDLSECLEIIKLDCTKNPELATVYVKSGQNTEDFQKDATTQIVEK